MGSIHRLGESEVWHALLALRAAMRAAPANFDFVSVYLGAGVAVEINAVAGGTQPGLRLAIVPGPAISAPVRAHDTVLQLDGTLGLRTVRGAEPPVEIRGLIHAYAPYCFGTWRARARRSAFAVSHFAQSLDGRIATVDGDSQSIGDDQNWIHAHRMRALCDAVLVGAGTLVRDRPRLNVRLVPGPNPRRVVLGQVADEQLLCLRAASAEPVLVLDRAAFAGRVADHPDVSPALVLAHLFELGIESVYVEGGARTTSGFFAAGALDVVQLHFAPLILGSGIAAFQFGAAPLVENSVRFSESRYDTVGEGIMFSGVPRRTAAVAEQRGIHAAPSVPAAVRLTSAFAPGEIPGGDRDIRTGLLVP